MQPNDASRSVRQDTDIVDVVGVFVRNRWRGLVIMCTVVAFGVGASFVFPAPYEAEGILRIASVDGRPAETIDALKAIFGADAVANEIVTTLGLQGSNVRERYALEAAEGDAKGDAGERWLVRVRGRGNTSEEAKAVAELVSSKVLARLEKATQPLRDILHREVENLLQEQEGIERETIRFEGLAKRFSNETAAYQLEIKKRADVQSEAQGRIVEAYIRLFADAKSRSDTLQHEIEALRQRFAAIRADVLRKQDVIERTTSRMEVDVILSGKSLIPPQLVQRVIYATVLGVFLAIVWILVREYHVVRGSNLQQPQQ